VPGLATGDFASGIVLHGEEAIPILEPGAIAGAWSVGDNGRLGFTDLQQSALREIANIGSGHAATALSQLVGRPVEIAYSEALLTVLAGCSAPACRTSSGGLRSKRSATSSRPRT
jgi:hypothetical protein